MPKKSVQGCIVALMLVLGTSPAAAQATADGAETIRAALQDWIDQTFLPTTEATITAAGPVTVTPSGSLYRATLPAFDVRMEDGSSFTIDAIPVELTPADNGWLDVSWRVPDTVVIYDAAGAEEGRVTITQQTGSGMFAPTFQTFMTMAFALEDVDLTMAHDSSGVHIERIVGNGANDEQEPGIYDQSGVFAIEGVQITDPSGGTLASLERFAVNGGYRDLRLADMAAYGESMQELTAALAALEGLPPEEAEPQAAAIVADFFSDLPMPMSGMAFNTEISNLVVTAPELGFSLSGGTTSTAMDGLDAEKAKVGFALGLAGIALDPAPPVAELLPTTGRIEIWANDLPTEALGEAFLTILQTAATAGPNMTEEEQSAAAMMALMPLQEAILASGSELEIAQVHLENSLSTLDASGAFAPDPASIFGITGSGTMTIVDLPSLIERANAVEGGQDAMPFLIMLQGMGTPFTDADGRIVHRYDFEMTPEGSVLVNGIDMMGMAGK